MQEHSHQRKRSWTLLFARWFVASVLSVSLFAAFVPLSAASSVKLCAMACCSSKAPHAAGACSSGLAKLLKKVQPQAEELCGLDHVVISQHARFVLPQADEDLAPESCGMQSDASAHSTAFDKKDGQGVSARALQNPCVADCGICSPVYNRQPRPREQATTAWAGRARPPSSFSLIRSLTSQTPAVRGHCEQAQPRGPPTSLS